MNRGCAIFILVFACVMKCVGGEILITGSSGEVSIAPTKKGPWKAVGEEKEFKAQMAVKTGVGAWVDLLLPGASRIRVPEKSTLEIERAEKDGEHVEVSLEIVGGRVLCLAKNLSTASKFEVSTSAMVGGVRGPEAAFEVRADGTVRCCSWVLVAIYIIAGTPSPPVVIESGQQAFLAPSGYKKEDVPKEIWEKVCGEIEKLRATIAK